jgi:4-amino-4-deoxy-L-arabinose transferase-like glycosyltransferase
MLLYIVLAVLYAIRTPAWQSPDEPAHYNYIAQVAANGCCPIIADGDWDQAYLDALRAERFAPALLERLPAVQYEDHQPPLYYLLMSPFYALTGGSLLALRLVTALFGLMVVINAYIVGVQLAPQRPLVAAGAALLVALLPQFVSISASVNNDAMSWALVGLGLVSGLAYLREESRDPLAEIGIGILAGLGLLTKVNTLMLLPLLGAVILLRWWQPPANRAPSEARRHLPALVQRLALFALPALLLGGPWWARNLATYGVPDLFGLAAHDRVVVGQLRTAELVAQLGTGVYWQSALQTTFQSFFAQLGWMALPLPSWIYASIGAGLLLALAGWLVQMLGQGGLGDGRAVARPYVMVLALAALLAVAQYVYYNTEFVQFQGRYLFTGIIPFALFVAGGLDVLADTVQARFIVSTSAKTAVGTPDEVSANGNNGNDGQNGRAVARPYGLFLIALLLPLNGWLLWQVLPGLAP